MNGHLKALMEKVIIRGTVEPLSALHIGWQRSFDPASSDAPVIKDPRGNPFIPGSSFKGILRGFIEGFLGGAGLNNCFPTDDEPCIKDPEKWKDLEYVLTNACPVCRIFGSSYMGSKLKIKDMPVRQEEWHKAFLRIRDGIIIDRDSRTAKDKGKYDFETVSPGVLFNLEIVGDNLDQKEKGLLFTAFDLISQGYASLGGNVSRGTGRIKIDIREVEIFRPGDFFKQFKENKGKAGPVFKRDDDLKQYMDAARNYFVNAYAEGQEVKDV
jgi:CRISPR-associated RAMP protein (TIGR02581 family)